MLVVDASAALYAATSEDGLAALAPFDPVAPPLMWSEAISVLHETLWRGAASRELAVQTRDRLLAAPIGRRTAQGLHGEAWWVADQLGWPRTYDAEYIGLARLLGCRLLTVDERLRRAAERLVNIIGPTEL
jgi:predicted nucleic acid-binding protein